MPSQVSLNCKFCQLQSMKGWKTSPIKPAIIISPPKPLHVITQTDWSDTKWSTEPSPFAITWPVISRVIYPNCIRCNRVIYGHELAVRTKKRCVDCVINALNELETPKEVTPTVTEFTRQVDYE